MARTITYKRRSKTGKVTTVTRRVRGLRTISKSMKSGKAIKLSNKGMWSAMQRAQKQGMKVSANKDGSATITLKDGRKFKIVKK